MQTATPTTTTTTLPPEFAELRIPEQKEFAGKPFPLVLQPAAATASWTLDQWEAFFKENSATVYNLMVQYGAVLFRNFPAQNAEHCDKWVKAFGFNSFPYVGGAAPRVLVFGNVFTTNEAPPDKLIPFHHEMAQVPRFPTKIFFFCEKAPAGGGETPIVPSNLVYEAMAQRYPDFVKALEEQGVRYTRVMLAENDNESPIGRGWKATYQTDSKEEVERKCKEQGIEFEWLPDDVFRQTTKPLSAVRVAPTSQEKVWFNQLVAVYTGWNDARNKGETAVRFADGTLLDGDAIAYCQKVKEENKVAFKWQEGDLIMIDNYTVMHARNHFVPPRRILACLCE